MAIAVRRAVAPATTHRPRASVVAPRPRQACTRALPLHTIAAAGDVDAPIGVIVGAAALITVAFTALVPLALSPGQEAANKIFSAKEKAPLDKDKKQVTGVTKKSRK